MRGLVLPGRRMPRICKYSWTGPADNLRPGLIICWQPGCHDAIPPPRPASSPSAVPWGLRRHPHHDVLVRSRAHGS